MSRKSAFSLIELLVVIGIIGVLIGLVMPVLQQSRQRAQATVCASNLRQLAQATAIYAQDDPHGRYPISSFPVLPQQLLVMDPNNSWVYTMKSYVDTHALAVCPSDASVHWQIEKPYLPGRLREVSYGVNVLVTHECDIFPLWEPSPPFPGNTNKIEQPSRVIGYGEIHETNIGAVGDMITPANWGGYTTSIIPGQPRSPANMDSQFRYHVASTRHNNKPQWSYLDGHVAGQSREEVYDPGTYDFDNETGQWNRNRFHPMIAR